MPYFCPRYFQSHLLQICCMWERVNPLNIFCQKIENLYNWMDNLWLKLENIVAKGEIARFEQFLLMSLCFQKAVCCRDVRKCLYEGKGYNNVPYSNGATYRQFWDYSNYLASCIDPILTFLQRCIYTNNWHIKLYLCKSVIFFNPFPHTT